MKRRDFLRTSAFAAGTAGLNAGILREQDADGYHESATARQIETPLDQSLPLRFRQVHLDFHTSGHIPEVGADFDPERFADTLVNADVNSVTLFGRCHHGYIYHETDKFPERRHPNAAFPKLLEAQIEACNRRNIRTPIYVTVQWDEFTAREHPEWLMRDEEGRPFGNAVFEPGFYEHLCVHTPYIDFLKRYLAELFEKVPVHGLFLDIHHVYPNANEACLAGMRAKGLDASRPEVRYAYYKQVMADYKEDLTAFIRNLDSDCTIFYNGGHVGPAIRNGLAAYTHLELESLPSGGWGYLHFPLTSRYARTLGKDVMGMTGRFHTAWGDFHSLKNRAALEFECFTMLALNAKCSIGDQLHPSGVMDEATYDLIGSVYEQVAEKEAWCAGANAVADIGVLSTEEQSLRGTVGEAERTPRSMMGIVRMLQEGKHQFDVLDSKSDFSPYKLLVLPDAIHLDENLASKLKTYADHGGAIIASYRSGLNLAGDQFASPLFGIELVGEAPYSPDFLAPDGSGLGAGLPATELVMYMQGMEVEATTAEALLMANVPYFNRTWEHFSSHRHTPSTGREGYPAATRNGHVIYFMHPLFTQYAANAPRWCREVFLNAVNLLLPDPAVRLPGAPSAMLAMLNEQPDEGRRVLHLLHYVPERRGAAFDVVEDVLPVRDVQVSVRAPERVRRVMAVPQGERIRFDQQEGRISFVVPRVEGHQMIEVGI